MVTLGRGRGDTKVKGGKAERRCSLTYAVHRLVAEAFLEKPEQEEMLEVHHINHERGDNRVENLMWITVKENRRLRKEPGRNGWKELVERCAKLEQENAELRLSLDLIS